MLITRQPHRSSQISTDVSLALVSTFVSAQCLLCAANKQLGRAVLVSCMLAALHQLPVGYTSHTLPGHLIHYGRSSHDNL
jgi:hypothetical protein